MLLNEEQEKAVKYNQGPLLIIAGAGTGKTTVIVEKIKYLLKKKLAQPEEILALTFTEKAAYEMEERVDQELPYGYFQMSISTFHAFAEQLLKEHGHQIGLNTDFKILTEGEAIIFLKKNLFLFDFKHFENTISLSFLKQLLTHFSRLKDEDIDPETYLQWVNKKQKQKIEEQELINQYQDLAYGYKIYQQLKIKQDLLDFSDLIFYLNILLKKKPLILKNYQDQFKYILVDEFQDTNISQYNSIKLLCPPKTNPHLTVVGDDSQAIYKFRGASVSNILNFKKDYPNAKMITLIKNYRSNQTILDFAYQLIQNNNPDTLETKLGISKRLISVKKDDKNNQEIVNLFFANSLDEEIDYIIKQIKQLTKTYQYQDIAILYRANNHIEPFINQLIKNQIPYQFLGTGFLLKQPEIKDLIAYFKLIYNLEDDLSLYRVLSMEIFHIDPQDLNLLISFSKKISQSLFVSIKIYLYLINLLKEDLELKNHQIYKSYLPLLKKQTKDKLLFLYHLIKKHLENSHRLTAGEILYDFLEKTNYLEKLTNIKTEKQEKTALNISKFFNFLRNYENNYQDASIKAVIEFLEVSLEMGESPTIAQTDLNLENAINLLTVHLAKGLEFPIVFLINLTKNRFPTNERKEKFPLPDELIKEILPEGNYHLQEERRLFYVALTRAKSKVFLTASKFYGEGIRQQKISPFVYETLGEKTIKNFLLEKDQEKNQLLIFDFKPKKSIQEKKLTLTIDNFKNQEKYFSYTRIETFDICPLKYKYQFILKLPVAYSASLSFGTSIHKTLQIFYQNFRKNKTISEKELIDIYHKNWIPLGYASSLQQQKNKLSGEKILRNFFQKFHHQSINILDLEKPFKIKIDNNLYLIGKIDRIDKINNQEIEIIDYKTGKKPEEKELKNNPQLIIYAWAASNKNFYNKPTNQINLSFYYLNKKIEKISFKKTEQEIIGFKEKLLKKINQIRQSDFSPKVGPHCDFCPFKIICDAW